MCQNHVQPSCVGILLWLGYLLLKNENLFSISRKKAVVRGKITLQEMKRAGPVVPFFSANGNEQPFLLKKSCVSLIAHPEFPAGLFNHLGHSRVIDMADHGEKKVFQMEIQTAEEIGQYGIVLRKVKGNLRLMHRPWFFRFS
jgi:hypothetical protein